MTGHHGSTTLIATDLDRTLIYSRAAANGLTGDVVAVERYQDADISFMTARAATAYGSLQRGALVVPTTTRTPEQLARVVLPGPAPRYAIAANGGVLLVDGRPDPRWEAAVNLRLAAVAAADDVRRHVDLACRPEWTRTVRTACAMFCYAVVDRDRMPPGFVEDESAWAAARGWRVSLQGRKVYWVPEPLTKSAAVAEVGRRTSPGAVLAAGDSLLDADLLLAADRGIAARHGELVASGWRAPHVDVTTAVDIDAGQEIVAWFASRLRTGVRAAQGPGPDAG